jgi:hypothetical protein
MSVTTFEGIVQDGRIQLPSNVVLPERAKVYVLFPDVPDTNVTPAVSRIVSPRLVHREEAAEFAKVVTLEKA